MPNAQTRGYGLFRDRVACVCLIAWLPVFEAELLRRGVIKATIDIAQLTGSADASAGTHGQGGAFDIWQHDPTTIKVAREMGAGAFGRTRAQGFDPHCHGVLNDCPHNGPARYQIAALAAGYNGLGYAGQGGKDDGPQPRKLRTWRQGIAWAKQLQEDDMALTAEDKNWLRKAIANYSVKNDIVPVPTNYDTDADRKKNPNRPVNSVLGRMWTVSEQTLIELRASQVDPDAVADAIVKRLGGSADAAAVKKALREVLIEGVGK